MWQEQRKQQLSQKLADHSDKHSQESRGGDSGFISSDFMSSSEMSSSSLSEPVNFESIMNMFSDCGQSVSHSFGKLSLEPESLNKLDSGKSTTIDSGIISMTTSSDDVEENCQESRQLYFAQNDNGDTLLHSAITQGFVEAALSLINVAPEPSFLDISNDEGQTALHLAVIMDQPLIARRLVLAGADLSVRDCQGNTALHLAVISGSLDSVGALTEDVTAQEKSLLSSSSSLSRRLSSVVPQILEQRNYHGETCLHLATSRNHVEMAKLLVRLGSDIEARESLGGRTPLHLGLERGCLDVVCYLLRDCRPHLDATTYSGYTAYQIASYVDEKLARELVKLGATPMDDEDSSSSSDDENNGFFASLSAAQIWRDESSVSKKNSSHLPSFLAC